MFDSVWRAFGLIPLKIHEAIHQACKGELAEAWRERDNLGETVKDMERSIAVMKTELSNAGTFITNRRAEIVRLEQDLAGTDRDIMEMRRQLLIRDAEVRAMRSIPIWTRRGKTFVRLQAGDNPISAHDPIIGEIAHVAAQAMTEELYRRAGGDRPDSTARLLIARSQPYTENNLEPQDADLSGVADSATTLSRGEEQQSFESGQG